MFITKDLIICLVGESGSGKTSIAKAFEELGYNVIQSFTTRPRRSVNETGHTFVKDVPRRWQKVREGDCEMEGMLPDKSDMIAYTFYNGHHYWATREQYKGKGITFYVIDPAGISLLKQTVTDARLLIIYLKVNQNLRIFRMEQQGRSIKEIFERCKADEVAFKIIECDVVIDMNQYLGDAIQLILKRYVEG
jgi:guanylate kinase